MITPQLPELTSAAPRRIGLYRYSVAGFLIALVVAFIGIPFIEPFDKDKHIEVILMTLVLVSGVLAVGGQNPGGTLASAELFDPTALTWTTTGSMANPRAYASLTLLPNGLVLAAGGRDGSGQRLDSAEVYDPATGLWSSAGALAHAREYPAAVVLGNGLVMVNGGLPGYVTEYYSPSAPVGGPSPSAVITAPILVAAGHSYAASLAPTAGATCSASLSACSADGTSSATRGNMRSR